MKRIKQLATVLVSSTIITMITAGTVKAADEVNVAFFLEWATPNMIAKAEGSYDDAMGVKINWSNFDTGTLMTEAMLAGDIDIAYSQGLAPFITAVNANAPIKMVGIAVEYPANPCIIRNGLDISMDNASELEGKSVSVPLATMADYSFRMQMRAMNVDVNNITVIDQVPADGAVALADGSVDMVCLFGGDSIKKAMEHGTKFMSDADMLEAGIISFDVVSVTEKFAQENPELLRSFLEVTNDSNKEFETDQSKFDLIMQESGMDKETTMNQMADMVFPLSQTQLETYFNSGGLAEVAIGIVGNAFATEENPAREDYSDVLDTSFLE